MNRRRVLGVGTAIVLAGLGATGLVTWANSAKSSAAAQQAQTAVVIVDKQVPKGADAATIKAATHVGSVERQNLAPGALTSEEQIGTQVAAADLESGDQLVEARLTQQVTTGHDDKVEVSATLSAERAVGGALKAGDTVGVYLSFDPFETIKPGNDQVTPNKTPNTTHLQFQKVEVTNVQATQDPVSSDKNNKQVQQVASSNFIVTLALAPSQSERFVFATEFGHVWLSKEPATVKDDGTGIVTSGNVYRVVK